MKIITLEEHYADQRIMDASNAFNKKPADYEAGAGRGNEVSHVLLFSRSGAS